ncbi:MULTISPECIES: hypothetical protein [unclassified Micromonospora]|uniref:hypothetical protein n=1 Tax=Micromonospora TaxID=1873 RepID=UPI0022B6CBE7|nr:MULTISPECIES: hypothetical protein [unclassified Micromonospora]MCZ7418199.1 hypothetical protein [Verrucosispora sp. WMMA2121]WBB91938.1 hypothetical protein O7597_02565 [Verrucosispora sp. WMMC514]
MSERELHCDICGSIQPFEAPPCVDGHGADCPERACAGCGAAIMMFVSTAPRRSTRRRAAVHHRAA